MWQNIKSHIFQDQLSGRSFLNAALIVGAFLLICWGAFFPLTAPEKDVPLRGHGVGTLERAVSGVFCGKGGVTLPRKSRDVTTTRWSGSEISGTGLSYFLAENLSQRDQPLKTAAAEYFDGDLKAYCEAVNHPEQLHDTGLAGLMYVYISIFPEISLNDLGYLLFATRLFLLMLGTAFLLQMGLSPFKSFLCFAFALGADRVFQGIYFYDAYPFISAFLYFTCCLLAKLFQQKTVSEIRWAILLAVFMGVFISVAGHFRVSLYLHVFALFVCFILFSIPHLAKIFVAGKGMPKFVTILGMIALTMVTVKITGQNLFQKFIMPEVSKDMSATMKYHTIAHPVVLGVGDMEDETLIMKKEGLKKHDKFGRDIVRSQNKKAPVLTDKAEGVLWDYYFYLWQTYPWDMIRTYLTKTYTKAHYIARYMEVVAKSSLKHLAPNKIHKSATGGVLGTILILAFYAACLYGCWMMFVGYSAPLAVFFSLVGLSALAIHAEMIVTYSHFIGQIFSSLAWLILLTCLLPFSIKKIKELDIKKRWNKKHG